MKSHVSRFRVMYLTALVAVASAIGAEFAALKDLSPAELSGKTWVFWLVLLAAVVVNAGNTILAALHPAPEPAPKPAEPTKPVSA